jgi:hypothetical protein
VLLPPRENAGVARREVNVESIGRRRWVIAERYIPSQGSFSGRALASHETACIPNAGDREAHIGITVFFADREPGWTLSGNGGAAADAAFALQRSQEARDRSPRHRVFVGV